MNKYSIHSSKNKQDIIKHLIALGTGKKQPRAKYYGLCEELGNYITDLFYKLPLSITRNKIYNTSHIKQLLVKDAATSWEYFSGDRMYPVPARKKLTVAEALEFSPQRIFSSTHKKWEATEYGDLRRDLCLHVAAYLNALRLSYTPEDL